jgi:hypothetical protein
MGFFSPEPKDRMKMKEIKKAMKHMDLSERQQAEALGHFETAGRESFGKKHIKEVARKMRSTSGDSLQSSQIDRIERLLHGHIDQRITPVVSEAPKKAKVINFKEYKSLKTDSLEVPKPIKDENLESRNEINEAREKFEGRFDKAA